MHSPHTFIGKVTVLLVGGALSWLTIMHPGFGQTMGRLLGARADQIPATELESRSSSLRRTVTENQRAVPGPPLEGTLPGRADTKHVAAEEPHVAVVEPPQPVSAAVQPTFPPPPELRAEPIEQVSAQLRQLGASYLLLERLPHPGGDRYRVRCDVAAGSSGVACCLEATGNTAVDAMNDVLQAVLSLEPSHQEFARAPTPSF